MSDELVMPERIKALHIDICGQPGGLLARESQFVFTYKPDESGTYRGPWLTLLMSPAVQGVYSSNAMFPVLDMNLPEGYLYEQIRTRFPKQNITEMHLLLAIGTNGIGRNSARLPDTPPRKGGPVIDRAELLRSTNSLALFPELVDAYLSIGAGVSGVQPKIMVPDRASIPVPTLIVKSGPSYYPGLSANEFMALSAAKRAGIEVAGFDLSADGGLLVLDRFDIREDGSRLGFEDIPALLGLQVRDRLDERKYRGSYELIAELLRTRLQLPQPELEKFFQQVAFSVLVRNGDAHLKNFGVLYSSEHDIRLAPMFDVLTTSIYKYTRFGSGEEFEDSTMALKLRKGDRHSTYPLAKELLDFAREVCRVERPHEFIERAAESMTSTLKAATQDDRIPDDLIRKIAAAWEHGLVLAKDVAALARQTKARPRHAQE